MQLYEEIVKLKNLLRRGWLLRDVKHRVESDAEHTFSMIILALDIMAKNNLDLDQLKVVKMIAYHEFGEIDAGDITLCDGVSKQQKYEMEYAGTKRIADECELKEIFDLWLEFEQNQTKEARFVKQLDKYECICQAEHYSKLENKPELFAEFYGNNKQEYDSINKLKK